MQAVDLGLPSGTLWADHNIGAKRASDAGLYFSWGNVDGVTAANASELTEAAYNASAGKQLTADIVQGGANDAATAALGTPWVMPTNTQFDELINDNYVTKEWTTQNGVNGYRITSKSNGNSIFLPAVGCVNRGSLGSVGSVGYYWSTEFSGEDYAYDLYFFDGDILTSNYNRYCGYSVRPVQNA